MFRKLSIESVSAIVRLGNIILLRAGQLLYREGDTDLKFYVIVFGWLNLVKRKEAAASQPNRFYRISDCES